MRKGSAVRMQIEEVHSNLIHPFGAILFCACQNGFSELLCYRALTPRAPRKPQYGLGVHDQEVLYGSTRAIRFHAMSASYSFRST
jgi:hypothetical protein